MEPFTAKALKERKRNSIKDFVSVAGVLHVSHMSIFSRTELGMYLKLCRSELKSDNIIGFSLAYKIYILPKLFFLNYIIFLYRVPRGPTLTFKIVNFTLARDVISMSKKQFVFDEAFKHSPLVVLNKFSGEGLQLKLMTSMFQNMFPTINLSTVSSFIEKKNSSFF